MLEAWVPFVLYNLVHVIHHEAVRKVPLKQFRDEQDLVTAIATNEHPAWRRHDVVIDGILLNERSNVVACHHRVFVDRLHLSKMSTELGRYANVAIDHAKQRSIDHGGNDLLLGHLPFRSAWKFSVNESLGVRFDPFLFPLTFPHFDHFYVPSQVGCVAARVFQQLTHRLFVHSVDLLGVGVAFRTAVKIAAVELLRRSYFCTPSIHRKLPNSLFAAISLMTDSETRSLRFAREPLDGHLSVRLGSLRPESVLRSTTRVPSRRHILRQRHRYNALAS